MSDVKVTPTEADREVAWPILAALGAGEDDRAQLMAGWDDGNHVVQAFARHRLQGWNECREAAAGWHEAQAEEHASHQVSAERLGAHISAQAHETRRHQHMRDAALIRNLTPSTPES